MSQKSDRAMTPGCVLGLKEVLSSTLLKIYTTVSRISSVNSAAVPTSLQTSFDGAVWVPESL